MDSKLWGGQFENSAIDAVKKFTESISYDKDLYKHDIMGSRSHALMLARQGFITEDDQNCILKGLDDIEGQIEIGEFVLMTDREDVHMNSEAALTDLVGELAKKLHTAGSRNDQACTDFRLCCRDAIDNIVMGANHLQLARGAGRLLDCRERMNFCPRGACALAGTGLPIDRFTTSEALGSIAPMRNRPNEDSDEGSGGGGNDIWIKTLAGVGLVIGGVVGLYLVYKTGQTIEREIVGAVRDWKEAGFPALVKIKIDKVGLKFSIY